jgi:hypothetical protein
VLIDDPANQSDGVDNNHNGITDEPGEAFRLDKSTYFVDTGNPNVPVSTPVQPMNFYNLLRGRWKDSTQIKYGGIGHAPASTLTTSWVYTGNPQHNTGWTEATAGNSSGDRRHVIASGPFSLPAGKAVVYGYAIVFSQDTVHPINTIDKFDSIVQRDVRNIRYYEKTHQASQCSPTIAVNLQNVAQHGLPAFSVFPVPATTQIQLNFDRMAGGHSIEFLDLCGEKTIERNFPAGWGERLDVSELPQGIYFLRVNFSQGTVQAKIIIAR